MAIVFGDTCNPAPIHKLFEIPTPPDTCKAPVEIELESVIFVVTIVPDVVNPPVKVDEPATFNVVPTYNDFAIPTPPETCTEPVDIELESVVLVAKKPKTKEF